MMTEEIAKEIIADFDGLEDECDIDEFDGVTVGEIRELLSCWRTVQKLPVTADGVRIVPEMSLYAKIEEWNDGEFVQSIVVSGRFKAIGLENGDFISDEGHEVDELVFWSCYSSESAARDAMEKAKQ